MQSEDDEPRIKQRFLLWILVFTGFSVNYMIRININIALIDMLSPTYRKSSKDSNFSHECFKSDELSLNESSINSKISYKNQSEKPQALEKYLLNSLSIEYDDDGFDWNEHIQGKILGSFFYLHFALQVVGGVWAEKFGTKRIFGLSNLIGCLLCSFMPLAAYINYRLLIALKILQGLICSMTWPSMHSMCSKWIPKNERGRFVSAYLGSSFGVAIFYPFFGWIMKVSSWEYVFHACSIIGTIWWLTWHFSVYDTPHEHPRISEHERNFLQEALSSSVNLQAPKEKLNIPWVKILTCVPVWANAFAQFGGTWGLFTILTQAPSYFRFIHGWDSTKIGLVSGLPHLCRSISSILVSQITDYLLTNQILNLNAVRKLGAFLCTIVNGIFVVGLAFSGCSGMLACICLILACASHGAVSSGPLASIIDISPKYSGVLLGLVNTVCCLPGFLSAMVVSTFTYQNQSTESWKMVFLITALMLFTGGIIFIILGDSTQQKWNKSLKRPDNNAEELVELKEVQKQ